MSFQYIKFQELTGWGWFALVWMCQQQNILVNSSAQHCLWYRWRPYNSNHCLKLSLWGSVSLIIVYSDLSFFYKNAFANNTSFSLYHSPSKESDFDLPSMVSCRLSGLCLLCLCWCTFACTFDESEYFSLILCLIQKAALCTLLCYLNGFQTVFQNSHMGMTMKVVSNCWWKLCADFCIV